MPLWSSSALLSSPPSGTESGVTTTTVDLLLMQWIITRCPTRRVTRRPMQPQRSIRLKAHKRRFTPDCSHLLPSFPMHRTNAAPPHRNPQTTAPPHRTIAAEYQVPSHPWHHTFKAHPPPTAPIPDILGIGSESDRNRKSSRLYPRRPFPCNPPPTRCAMKPNVRVVVA